MIKFTRSCLQFKYMENSCACSYYTFKPSVSKRSTSEKVVIVQWNAILLYMLLLLQTQAIMLEIFIGGFQPPFISRIANVWREQEKQLMFSYVLMSIRVLINKVLLQRSQFYPKIEMLVDILLLHILRNGPDKNDSNNGNEHVGMQKRC